MSFLPNVFSDASSYIDPTHFKGLPLEMTQNFPSVPVDKLIENRYKEVPLGRLQELGGSAKDFLLETVSPYHAGKAFGNRIQVTRDSIRTTLNPVTQVQLPQLPQTLEAASKSLDPIKLAERVGEGTVGLLAGGALGTSLARKFPLGRPSVQQIEDVADIADIAEEVSRVPTNNAKGKAVLLGSMGAIGGLVGGTVLNRKQIDASTSPKEKAKLKRLASNASQSFDSLNSQPNNPRSKKAFNENMDAFLEEDARVRNAYGNNYLPAIGMAGGTGVGVAASKLASKFSRVN